MNPTIVVGCCQDSVIRKKGESRRTQGGGISTLS